MSPALTLLVAALGFAAAPAQGRGPDSDGDGLPDHVEDRDGDGRVDPGESDPYAQDSDRDGKLDGVEDRDGDGRVDPGESDPRVPGLFPGTTPHIPEPLAFDLVRGLGARKGEVEFNTLLAPRWSRRHALAWAPEIEWAPRDDLALEFELPMVDGHLHALKVAVQGTLPRRGDPRFITGWQIIGEFLPGQAALETTALYLAGLRLNRRWSVFGMGGMRLDWSSRPAAVRVALLVNPSVFMDLRERLTVGLEHNLAVGLGGQVHAMLLPQFHFQLDRRWRLQCGLGAELAERRINALGALRLVLEF